MSAEDSGELFLPVQVRDLPRARVAQVGYTGPAPGIGAAFERVNQFVLEHGIGPCGPLIGVYDRIGEPEADVHALVQVPVTRLLEDGPHGGIDTVRLGRIRAASLMFHGEMGPGFRQAHFDLFAWMDTQGLPRAGTAHQHAYIAGTGVGSEWTIEIRVPIVGGLGPGLAV
jgi:hypothetical protein